MKSFDDATPQERASIRRPLVTARYRFVRKRWHVVMAVIDAAIYLLLWAAQKLGFASKKTSRQPIPPSFVRRILLLQLDHLGDAVITTAMLAPLQARYPHARIEVLASPEAKPIFAAAPEVAAVHVFEGARFARSARRWLWPLRLLSWAWRLRNEHYDLGIDVRGDLPHALLLWLAGIPERVGWAAGGGGHLLTRSADYIAARPELESRAALLAQLGVRKHELNPRIVVPAKIHRQVAALLPQDGAQKVVIHVGAGMAAKRWPVENFGALLSLLQAAGVQPILVGTNADRALAEQARVESGGVALNWCGALSVLELAALCRQAELFIGADSGPAHLAAAVGAPTLALFSGTNHREQWKPVGQHVRTIAEAVACSPCHRAACVWKEHPCMSGLQPAAVAAEAIAMLHPVHPHADPLPVGEGVGADDQVSGVIANNSRGLAA